MNYCALGCLVKDVSWKQSEMHAIRMDFWEI